MAQTVAKPRKTPSQLRSRETVDRILAEAARIFDARGYAATTTNHVADAAGVSVGSLYQYFPNKDAILFALAERHLAEGAAVAAGSIDGLAEDAAPEAVVRQVVDAVVDLHRVNPGMHQLLFERIPQSPELRELFARVESQTVDVVQELLLRYLDDPEVARRRAPIVVTAVEALVHRMVLDGLVRGDAGAPDDLVDEIVTLVLAYLEA